MHEHQAALLALRRSMELYAPISDQTWSELTDSCTVRALKKRALLYRAGEQPDSYAYLYRGLIRGFVCDEKGNEYNKNFFTQGQFPGSMTALLTSSASALSFEAIEDSLIIEIDFASYRKLMIAREDLKLFQIYYLEKNWLLAKDAREIEIVQHDASVRYRQFMERFPGLSERLPQYHIASHLGITPTQLSRIRKNK